MKAAVLREYGVPRYDNFPAPSPRSRHAIVTVNVASLNAIDIALASGRHPLSPKALPVVTGVEGVGVTGHRRVYFFRPPPPYGSMAQTTLVPETNMFDLPDELDDPRAAALGNGGLAALMPLRDGAAMREGEGVLILGATGVVGQLAIQCAAKLGAGQIVAAGRDPDALRLAVARGATSVINLSDDVALDDVLRDAVPAGFDVILDYLGGAAASAASRALAPRGRFIQLGDRAGGEMTLSVASLRALGASLTGFMPTHYGLEAVRSAYEILTRWTLEGRIVVTTTTAPFHDVEQLWRAHGQARAKGVLMVTRQG